jgi:hypothetical protein
MKAILKVLILTALVAPAVSQAAMGLAARSRCFSLEGIAEQHTQWAEQYRAAQEIALTEDQKTDVELRSLAQLSERLEDLDGLAKGKTSLMASRNFLRLIRAESKFCPAPQFRRDLIQRVSVVLPEIIAEEQVSQGCHLVQQPVIFDERLDR